MHALRSLQHSLRPLAVGEGLDAHPIPQPRSQSFGLGASALGTLQLRAPNLLLNQRPSEARAYATGSVLRKAYTARNRDVFRTDSGRVKATGLTKINQRERSVVIEKRRYIASRAGCHVGHSLKRLQERRSRCNGRAAT